MAEGSASSPPATAPLTTYERTFAAIPREVGQARRFLAGLLDGQTAATDAITCLSELATNAVLHSVSRHPGGTLDVRVTVGPGLIRIEVTDAGGAWQDDGSPGDGQRGRGLAIVAALATSWGITGDASGRSGWCEFICAEADQGQ